jgi:hypothetical protein
VLAVTAYAVTVPRLLRAIFVFVRGCVGTMKYSFAVGAFAAIALAVGDKEVRQDGSNKAVVDAVRLDRMIACGYADSCCRLCSKPTSQRRTY